MMLMSINGRYPIPNRMIVELGGYEMDSKDDKIIPIATNSPAKMTFLKLTFLILTSQAEINDLLIGAFQKLIDGTEWF